LFFTDVAPYEYSSAFRFDRSFLNLSQGGIGVLLANITAVRTSFNSLGAPPSGPNPIAGMQDTLNKMGSDMTSQVCNMSHHVVFSTWILHHVSFFFPIHPMLLPLFLTLCVPNAATLRSSQASSKLSSIQSTFSTVQNQLVSIQSSISGNIDSGLDTLRTTSQKVVDPYTNLKGSYKQQASDGDNMRNIGLLVIFILPATSILAVLVGGAFKSGCPFTTYYWIGYVGSFLVFLMFAVHLPVAVVLSDGCTYVSRFDANFSSVGMLSSGSPAPVRALLCSAFLGPFTIVSLGDFILVFLCLASFLPFLASGRNSQCVHDQLVAARPHQVGRHQSRIPAELLELDSVCRFLVARQRFHVSAD
jgi:hypothetical protein